MEGATIGSCFACGKETNNVNEVGNHVCTWCERQLDANPEVEDEEEYLKTICGHPPKHRKPHDNEFERCPFCNAILKKSELPVIEGAY